MLHAEQKVRVRITGGDARVIESHEFLKLKFLVIHGWFYLSAVHTNDRLCINQPIDSQIIKQLKLVPYNHSIDFFPMMLS